MFRRPAQRSVVLSALALAVYVGAYVILSRVGYAAADKDGTEGFYYCTLEGSSACRFAHLGCRWVFWPLNAVDQCLGLGRPPASLPLESLE
jgi:hypothetical protein